MNKRLKNEILENNVYLEPIVETLILCGKQNFPLHRHHDDVTLKHHLEICGKNTTYISKTTQKELISIIGNLILGQVIGEFFGHQSSKFKTHFFTCLICE